MTKKLAFEVNAKNVTELEVARTALTLGYACKGEVEEVTCAEPYNVVLGFCANILDLEDIRRNAALMQTCGINVREVRAE